jgi:long-chain acyl-CoA synthetase
MAITRVFDVLEKLKNQPVNPTLLNRKENKVWKPYSTSDFIEHVNQVSCALMHLGLKKGDVAAIISTNRPEWNFVDYGCQQAGIVTAPIFPTISIPDLKFILNHCEAKIVFVSDKALYAKLASIENELTHVKLVFSFSTVDGVKPFSEFLTIGKQNCDINKLNSIKESVLPGDLMTILYTSGTTGIPKGVMLSHANLVSNVMASKDIVPFETSWKSLSFLPLNHVYERMVNTMYIYQGISIYYLEHLELLGDTAREVQPTLFVAVPRLIERVHERIMSAGEKLTGFKKGIFNWAVKLANAYEGEGKHGLLYTIQRFVADKLVYSKWRAGVGGNLRYLISGGAALNAKLERVFSCANIQILQGYGLTETSPVISVNRLGKNNALYGSVGPVIDGVEVKIAAEDGEILMRGPNMMLGYYKNPEATAEMIDSDGWLHTGDVGTFVENRFLKITDRKKEIFKTSSGKYIAPMAIENKIKECKFVENCMVVGEYQKFASALIVPAIANFKEHCESHGIAIEAGSDITAHPELKRIISEHIKVINKTLAPYEQLKRCELVGGEWTVDGGEVTPKLSLKRKVIKEKHSQVIDKIFAVED